MTSRRRSINNAESLPPDGGHLKNQGRAAVARRHTQPAWSDGKKYWMETCRTVVLAVLGGIAAIQLLKPREQKIAFAGEVLSTKLRIRADAIEQFTAASYAYTVAAYKACKYPLDKGAMDSFETNQNEQRTLARMRLERSFDLVPLTHSLRDIDNVADSLHRMCRSSAPYDTWNDLRRELQRKNADVAGVAWRALELDQGQNGDNLAG
jgi:hypothetical protein